MEYQSNPVTQNRRLYPFTENNPFLPWYKKVKVAMFGEGTFDSFQRIKDQAMVDQWYEAITVGKGKYVGGITPADTPLPSGVNTPNIWTNVGVGVKHTWSTFGEQLHNLNIENKLNSITPTLKTIPTQLPDAILSGVTTWENTVVDKTSISEASDFVKEWKNGGISNSSKVKIEELKGNPFKVLKEETI